jgi:hypothetical protein
VSGPSSSTSSDPTWVSELISRLSSTTTSDYAIERERADSVIIPVRPSTPSTSQLRPSIPPPNSPTSVKHWHNFHPQNCDRGSRTAKYSSRQDASPRQITVNKIKVYVTVEVITEDGDKNYPSPEIHASASVAKRAPRTTTAIKRRPRMQISYARSPSPAPIKPCPIEHVTRRSILDEDCSICSISLNPESMENLVWCKGACGNNFHKSCFDQWRTYAARPLRCVHW